MAHDETNDRASDLPDMLTPAQTADRWQVHADHVRTLIRSGELPAIDVSNRRGGKPGFLIRRTGLLAIEEGRRVPVREVGWPITASTRPATVIL